MNEVLAWYEQALGALNQGRWRAASEFARRVLVHAPTHGGTLFIAGVADLSAGNPVSGLHHLAQASAAEPQRLDFIAQHARALVMTGRLPEAVAMAERGMRLAAHASMDASSLDTLGVVFTRANLHERAAEATRRAVDLSPEHPGYRFNLATSLMFSGDFSGSERQCEQCLRIEPRFWRAYLSRSQVRTTSSDRSCVEQLETLLIAHAADPDAQLYLRLALARELELLGDPSGALREYVRGKHVHRRRITYSTARDEREFDAARAGFMAILERGPLAHPGDACSSEPIFIMGMPRSGTTLVDRILSRHPDVHSAGELGNFADTIHQLVPGASGSLAGLGEALSARDPDWSRIGLDYIRSTRPGTGRTPRFTDKLPHNFLYLGFIARALPAATIVVVRRNPMDTCLGNLRQLFALDAPRYDYSYDLLETGRYYLLFDGLMRFWQEALPGRIVEVRYEDLVNSSEATIRSLLASCGLEWDPGCLTPERGGASISTASAVQARSPINQDSIHRWRRVAPMLGELKTLLESSGLVID